MLLKLIDHVTNNDITLKMYDIVPNIFNGADDSPYTYISYDLSIYVVFRIMNKDTLKLTGINSLSMITNVALSIDANIVITDTLLKYLPDDSEYKSQQFRDSIRRAKKPSYYKSLFEEDI